MGEPLCCWEWTREIGGKTRRTYMNLYPGLAEQYDSHEVRIVFWGESDG